jgi:outer membrane protein assembly factor BamA
MRFAAIVLILFIVALPRAADAQGTRSPQPTVPAFAYVGRPVEDNAISIEGRPALEPPLFALLATRTGHPLSIADVRETITHFYSLGRFDDVQVEAESSPSGTVHLRYLLHPIHAVFAVKFRGSLGVPESMVRQRMAERFGETPPAARAADVAAALEDLYREEGYLEADVRAAAPIVEHNPDRTTLVFDVNAGGRARISRTNIVGDPIEPQAELIGRLGVQPGQPYRSAEIRRRLAEHVQRLRHRGYYQASATVESATISPDRMQADLTIAVRPGPLVTVRYDGDPIPREKLAEFVPIEREGSVDEDLLEDAKNRITAYLTQQGYWRATVTHTEQAGPGTLAIVFHITRGSQYHVGPDGVEVSGNASIPIEEFRPALRTLAPGDPFVAAKLDATVGAITRVYQTRGFATMKAQSAVDETQPGLVRPVITIVEGPHVVVGTVSIGGNTSLKTEELIAHVTSKTGAPYYGPTVASDRDAILVEYLNAGYSGANVTITPRLSPDGTRADLPLTVV